MPSPMVQTDHELFCIGDTIMQMMNLADGTVLATATKASGIWSVTIPRDTTLNTTITDRPTTGAYMAENGPAPSGTGVGWSTWIPDLTVYGD